MNHFTPSPHSKKLLVSVLVLQCSACTGDAALHYKSGNDLCSVATRALLISASKLPRELLFSCSSLDQCRQGGKSATAFYLVTASLQVLVSPFIEWSYLGTATMMLSRNSMVYVQIDLIFSPAESIREYHCFSVLSMAPKLAIIVRSSWVAY